MKLGSLDRILGAFALLGLTAVGGVLGLGVLRGAAAERLYQQKIAELVGNYRALEVQYNDAVKQTAVTELIVEENTLDVRVRTAAGETTRIRTSADPSGEVYVDFAIIDGRIWIRRVFDEHTPPSLGTVIDPALADIDWDAEGARQGQAVYRSLGEGRWIVAVTGNGSMGLARAPEGPVDLAPAPQVGEYEQIEEELDRSLEQISTMELLRGMIGGR